ncbi:DNA-binding MarR family transcriptional regulator [Catenulispora sp. MAP12-49]|uniref:MarR family winged helix-turn-helix transcriptional regulator n=1 Tax=Catenulispora sp. MAP12-49 TaxID=3156302 RepID=UPI0035147584
MTPEARPAGPSLDQARRQIRHYGLDADPQSILVAARLMAVGARLGQAAEVHFSRFGLSTGRYRLLADLEDHGGGKSPSQLAAGLGVTRATVTGLLAGLEREGLVVRSASAEDGRGAVVSLTEQGAQRLQDMAAEHFERLQALVGTLSTDERGQFLGMLERIDEGIGAFVAD